PRLGKMDMQHLSPERIAALIDEPATHDEGTHLESCGLCRADFVAIRRIVAAAAGERDRPVTPLVPWQQLSAALLTAGVVGGRMLGSAGGAGAVPEMAAVQTASPSIPMTNVAQFRSPDDARATLRSAEQVYSGALLWLAAHDSALSPRVATGSEAAALNYRQRLEVLDAAMATARRALYEAPDDPVMNRYYLATLGAREVTLRRLTTVLPASQQVLEY
ncbi:MAG TPA: hypothetical protein VE861_13530, partial [Gemmatimonadaceae bacterium]|nr:hypothetical protein [Gemmatimonadaceae bacterium]